MAPTEEGHISCERKVPRVLRTGTGGKTLTGEVSPSGVFVFQIHPTRGHLYIYPNPINDVRHLAWEELPAGTATLSAHDISGRLLGAFLINGASGSLSLDIRTWPAGVSFLSVRSDHWMTLPLKVIVE